MKLDVCQSLAASLLSGLALANPHLQNRGDLHDIANNPVQESYLVEFEDGQTADDFFTELNQAGVEFEKRQIIDSKVFRGASFRVLQATASEETFVKRIASQPRVKQTWPVGHIQVPQPKIQPLGSGARQKAAVKRRCSKASFAPHAMMQIDKLHAKGFTGKGIRVGIVDTGVDYTHPALGGCFGPGCLVSKGGHFSDEGASDDDGDLVDESGHGTHIAGIVAAQPNEYGFVGAAPGVDLGIYKFSSSDPFPPHDTIVAALTRAYDDGSDVISISQFTHGPWSQSPVSLVVSRIVAAGVPVFASTGNAGSDGPLSGVSPAAGKNVMAIGIANIPEIPVFLMEGSWSSGDWTEYEFGWTPGSECTAPFESNLTLPLWAASTDLEGGNSACQPLSDGVANISSSFVLARLDSSCDEATQIEQLTARGAEYILFYTTSNGTFSGAEIYSADSPVAMVPPFYVADWLNALENGDNVTISVTESSTSGRFLEYLLNDLNANSPSTQTSWGPTHDMELKPQIVAPGEHILSTWPLSLDEGGFRILSGSSMATPMAAGLCALLMEALGSKDPQEITNAMISSAEPLDFFDTRSVQNFLAPVAQQGTGLPQGLRALETTTKLNITSLSFNDTDYFKDTHAFSILNGGDTEITYTLSHIPGRGAYAIDETAGNMTVPPRTYPTKLFKADAEVKFSANKITVRAGETAEVTLTGAAPSGLDNDQLPVYGGYIKLDGSNGERLLLPYVGVATKIRDIPILRAGQEGGNYLWLSTFQEAVEGAGRPLEANQTVRLPRPASGQFADQHLFFSLTSRIGTIIMSTDLVALDGTEMPTTDFFGYPILGRLPYQPTQWTTSAVSGFIFITGLLDDDVIAPEGRYQLITSTLRVTGNASDRADWDIVESVPFNLEYLD